ncbi:PQQ-like beta-propeller repeat protein [bacterium]|nr:PQQ-like beta-propeller repeat protein [bacterium]
MPNTIWKFSLNPTNLKFPLNLTNEIFTTNVLIGDDNLFIGSFDKEDTNIYALHSKTGDMLWTKRLNGKSSSFALKDNKLILTTEDRVYALNINTGNQLWNTSMPDGVIVNIPPVISGNLIYFFNSKNRLCLLDLSNGTPATMLGNIEVTGVNSFSLSNFAIFITSGIGRVFKYSISGGLIWSWENRGIAGVDSITSYPVVSERTMITGSGMGYLYIFDLTSSTCQVTIKRTFTKAIRSSPAISDSRMFVCSVDGELYAYA